MPVYNGLTDEWHPTQILADFLTFRGARAEAARRGDLLLPGRRALQHGRQLPRSAARSSAWTCGSPARARCGRGRRSSSSRAGIAEQSGAKITITEDVEEAVKGCDVLLTDVWVSMGEPAEVWEERIELLLPYQVNARRDGADRQPGRQVHALPARVPQHATRASARSCIEKYGLDALEVTEEVFESPASIVFDEAENRMHTIKAVLVATLGS